MAKKNIEPDSPLIGRKMGRLTVINTWKDADPPYVRWLVCNCDCGTTNHVCRYNNFQTGRSKSCGCLQRSRIREVGAARRTHGDSLSATYKYWGALRKRGGVAGGWEAYDTFKAFVGDRIRGSFIIRKDNMKPFSPENFSHWGSQQESMRQRRDGHFVTVRGETKSISEWADLVGVSRQAFHQWLTDPRKTRSDADIEAYIYEHDVFRQRVFAQAANKRRNTAFSKRSAGILG